MPYTDPITTFEATVKDLRSKATVLNNARELIRTRTKTENVTLVEQIYSVDPEDACVICEQLGLDPGSNLTPLKAMETHVNHTLEKMIDVCEALQIASARVNSTAGVGNFSTRAVTMAVVDDPALTEPTEQVHDSTTA